MFPAARARTSPEPATHVIVAGDPAESLPSKPSISDILRTHFCIPGSILLVEGIDAAIPVSKRFRAIRLLLSDGELCIQALLRRELHGLLEGEQLHIGSHVKLTSFELRTLRSDGGPVFTRKPHSAVVLVVNKMDVVGADSTFRDSARAALSIPPERAEIISTDIKVTTQIGRQYLRATRLDNSIQDFKYTEPSNQDDDFEVLDVSEEQATQRRFNSEAARNPYRVAQFANTALPWVTEDLTQPLRLTLLAAIPNLPYKQNWMVNVLAIVASLSDVEPATLPPFTQRTARLVDPSTSKQVLLTVFLEPEAFAPKIGSVVLLVGVKNHRFDGGSLKKYGNEKPKDGTTWWIENPWNISWCDVAGLKQWWQAKGSDGVYPRNGMGNV